MKRLLRDRFGVVWTGHHYRAGAVRGVRRPAGPVPAGCRRVPSAARLLPPIGQFFGTDRMGADMFSRLLFGARLTILIAVVATSAAVLIGVPVGLVAGYYNNRFSDLLMRVSDVFLAVPQIVLAIAIAQTLGPAIQNVILALSITYWPFWARWFTPKPAVCVTRYSSRQRSRSVHRRYGSWCCTCCRRSRHR